MLSEKITAEELSKIRSNITLTYGSRHFTKPIPKFELPEDGMPSDVAYQIIHDELNLDGNPTLNLASFVSTWMEPEAEKLMTQTLNKNYVDQDEYPQTTKIQNRCVNMLARLFNAPNKDTAIGTATVGSSEAIHLCGLSMKWHWRDRRQKDGLPHDKPNIVMGHNVQVCWEKFARYFEVEPRYVPLTNDRFIIGVDEALNLVDENTIGVVGILGSTYTGEFEPVQALNDALDKLNKKTGWDVPIHVDAASGGFVAPFLYPKLKWDFCLPWVRSINVSGHKYGLVYPGVGWAIWRDKNALHDDLIFHVNYLGGDEPTFNLNFSKGANNIIAQYYNFLRLGFSGYKNIMENLMTITKYLGNAINTIEELELVSDFNSLPLVCFKLKNPKNYTVFELSNQLRERGWVVPAYTMAPNAENVAVLRAVIREGFSLDMAEMLITDIQNALAKLKAIEAGIIKKIMPLGKNKKVTKIC
ncbi:MAG: glutamate decarboxylase [Gammaproteobacteria bacterium]|nr:glutamate decarboxylase [Gammaproteobacteria bacterium]